MRCRCGASYRAFRCGYTFAEVHAMLRVSSDDPELWLNRSRGAILRELAMLKRAIWDSVHGYCHTLDRRPARYRLRAALDSDRVAVG
jgi:hypothetical protein